MKKFNCWLNIFDNNKIVQYDENDCYLIQYKENKCILLRNRETIVEDESSVFEKYNVFEAQYIGVDVKSFLQNEIKSYEEISKIIIEQYKLSYIHKLIFEKKLRYRHLEKYLEKFGCKLFMEEVFSKYEYKITILDNNGKLWDVYCFFQEDEYNRFDPYLSLFKLL